MLRLSTGVRACSKFEGNKKKKQLILNNQQGHVYTFMLLYPIYTYIQFSLLVQKSQLQPCNSERQHLNTERTEWLKNEAFPGSSFTANDHKLEPVKGWEQGQRLVTQVNKV